jgi:dihydropteroate synthase
MYWQTTRYRIDLAQPRVMGIVNVTPDSFSDGGRHATADAACRHADRLVAEGADILDIGGESTRPGSPPVPADEELKRILPVLRHALTLGVAVSVDTSKTEVMREVLASGADIINDVRALADTGALSLLAAQPQAGVCLMHMRGTPLTMQVDPRYADDVVGEVAQFLAGRARALRERRVASSRIVVDPGIGFGKTVAHNFALLARQRELLGLGYPLMVGWSRKSSLGAVTGRDVEERLISSLAAALLAAERGARILRVHDVAPTVEALKVWRAAAV